MTDKQKKLLETIQVKKHDPDGVSVRMIADRLACSYSRASEILRRKIADGEAVECWMKHGHKWVRAMKLK